MIVKRHLLPIALAVALVACAGSSRGDDKEEKESNPKEIFAKDFRPILEKYCYRCHGDETQKGDLNLEKYKTTADVDMAGEVFRLVVARLRAAEMPPTGARQLTFNQGRDFRNWLDARPFAKVRDCNQIAGDNSQNNYRGNVMSRRLSRAEYNHSIRDLIGLDLRPADRFPSDGSGGEGFDTNGDSLFTSAIHVEMYLDAAETIVTAALADPAARKRLLVAEPGSGLSPRDAAKRVVAEFARRAVRRPVADAEVDRWLAVFDKAIGRGDAFDVAIKLPLKAVLISPNFLFLVEPGPEKDGVYGLGGYPLAARLSYFVWASMPDEELFRLAADGSLTQPEVLGGQVRRMLRDPKARDFAENFVSQWLGLKALGETVNPDPQRFPEFDAALADAMRQEPARLFDTILREDRSLLELLDADYTFVNEKLATIYGIEGVTGSELRRVSLTDKNRGGVLTMAGPLAVSSMPLRTSPVVRGKWVLGDLLGTKIPPPPPNAGELPPDDRNTEGLTLRKQLELHRSKAECAGCHQKIDPLGFGLENFDPLGRWRTTQNGQPVDATGELPTGEKFTGPRELKDILLKRKSEFLRHLTRKTLGYALGRPLNRFDECVLDETVKALEAKEYRASVMIEQVVLSYAFRHRYAKK
jgi:mono/diheme cytochrome c family protein